MTPPTPPLSCEYEANININMKSADTNMLATLPYETDPNLHKPACEKKATSLNDMNSNSAAKSLEELKALQPQEETFPQQLMNLLESETYDDIDAIRCPTTTLNVMNGNVGEKVIEWLIDDSFIIRDKITLEQEVLPKYFDDKCKFMSFVRKLYRWGFRHSSKSTRGVMVFAHPHFQRGNKAGCLRLRSIVAKRTKKKKKKKDTLKAEPKKKHQERIERDCTRQPSKVADENSMYDMNGIIGPTTSAYIPMTMMSIESCSMYPPSFLRLYQNQPRPVSYQGRDTSQRMHANPYMSPLSYQGYSSQCCTNTTMGMCMTSSSNEYDATGGCHVPRTQMNIQSIEGTSSSLLDQGSIAAYTDMIGGSSGSGAGLEGAGATVMSSDPLLALATLVVERENLEPKKALELEMAKYGNRSDD